MQPKRVVVTGMSGITALGSDWETVEKNLRAGVTGIEYMSEWEQYKELNTRLGAPVKDFKLPPHYTRKHTRTMSRVAQMAVLATEQALAQAGLLNDPIIQDGRMGIAHGSCSGGFDAFTEFGGMMWAGAAGRQLNATTFLRFMTHTAGVNIGLYFGLKGRIIPTTSACTSGSQGVGYAYESIKYGKQLLMVAGGSEELHAADAAVFDTMFATSLRNDAPKASPRPFDKARDGLVIGEGAGTLILEELEHAQRRGAPIFAEVVGFGSNSDGDHATHPNTATMQVALELALQDAGLPPEAIGYVSAHGTSTEQGDIAESQATSRVFGSRMPISSMKSYLGHTLGACGAVESWWAIEMMNRGWFAPTHNLAEIDERCGRLDYIAGEGRRLDCEYVMNNNFAFGGINTSLIFKRWA
ncbi:MAG TPA: beta-ketoacyl-ACP synthase [Stenotrophobium sp.]|jgi:3-oxoacyl-[acyl-carrier-protein] synthase II|nr:beta-ketoacyl-ACP synthase [Stenotrophobium sp.]